MEHPGLSHDAGKATAMYRPKDPASKWTDKEAKPDGYIPPKTTLIDEMLAGKKSPMDIAEAIVQEAYGPLRQYCSLPAGFANRILGYERCGIEHMSAEEIDGLNHNPPPLIIDPKKPQIEAIRLLEMFLSGDPAVCQNGDPYQPMFGANFVGPPGCGKTHIMSAFARRMKEFLDEKLKKYRTMVAEFVKKEYNIYRLSMEHLSDAGTPTSVWNIDIDESGETRTKEKKHPSIVFLEKLDQFKIALARLQYQPPDLLYLDFDALWELCRADNASREQALEAIIRAKVLFLDDVHPKGDIERMQIVLHVIEGRYAAGRMGTFMTTNLTTEEIVGNDKDHQHIAQRLTSRCNEMFYEVNFKDCDDWRTKVKRRRIAMVQEYLRGSIAAEVQTDGETTVDETSGAANAPEDESPASDEPRTDEV